MNDTIFSIYKSGIPDDGVPMGPQDIKKQDITRQLYIRNCDCKMAGNISSIYQTVLALFNLSQDSFYYSNEIVNVFLEKMENTLATKVHRNEEKLAREILDSPLLARILAHILADKFKKSSLLDVSMEPLTPDVVESLLRHIVQQKFELRNPSGDIYDKFIRFLSGEQQHMMEISYTKQQQKQKQKQKNKNQDSDTMEIFHKKNQLEISVETNNYFEYSLAPDSDIPRNALNLPISVPILSLTYTVEGKRHNIDVYPTLQFLYSHHIQAQYISKEVKEAVENGSYLNISDFCKQFLEAAAVRYNQIHGHEDFIFDVGQTIILHGLTNSKYNGQRGKIVCPGDKEGRWGVQLINQTKALQLEDSENIWVHAENMQLVVGAENATDLNKNFPRHRLASIESADTMAQLDINLKHNYVRQNPQYTLAALREGVYVIGMKDQFNIHDLKFNPLSEHIQYVADEMGFVLFDKTGSKNVDILGPYFIEQYILMEVISKLEVAQNVLKYYVNHKDKLQRSVDAYDETQGKGFICWRFLFQNRKA
uniref:Uncharacterized protein n=1 Tax=Aplanochytrium stocchinoi TaxID=215587 RepID=A0A7S3LQ15_9STRA